MKGTAIKCLVFCIFVSAALILIGHLAQAVEKKKDNQTSATQYWMDIATQNQSIPGLSGENSPMAGMMGKMMGRHGLGPNRSLFLRLDSPNELPSEQPVANHNIPPGLKMGDALPLIIPQQEKARPEKYEEGRERPMEKPKMRMLIYWGCSETVAKGQPRVIDTQKMTPVEFGKALAPKYTSSVQHPPGPRDGWIYAEWPNRKSSILVPNDGSLQGAQLVHGNYTPDIKFTVDDIHDFMAPVEFTSVEGGLSDSIKFQWKPVPTALGYYAMAVSHNEKTGETVFWVSSEVPDAGFGLMDYLPSGDVKRFIKDKIVMGSDITHCAIPKGIFKDSAGSMIQFIAYGDELNIVYPPKPKDPKALWKPIWTVKLRLKSTGMVPVGTGDRRADMQNKKEIEKMEKESSEGGAEEKSEETRPEGGSPLKKLKGLFGF